MKEETIKIAIKYLQLEKSDLQLAVSIGVESSEESDALVAVNDALAELRDAQEEIEGMDTTSAISKKLIWCEGQRYLVNPEKFSSVSAPFISGDEWAIYFEMGNEGDGDFFVKWVFKTEEAALAVYENIQKHHAAKVG